MASILKIKFGKAQNGWLPLEITTESKNFEFNISHSPNNFLTNLAESLITFLNGIEQTQATLNEEPIEYEFDFFRNNKETKFKIICFKDHRRSKNSGKTILTIVSTPERIILPFWRAFKELQSRIDSDEFKHHWHHDFPIQEMKRLDKQIKLLKNNLG